MPERGGGGDRRSGGGDTQLNQPNPKEGVIAADLQGVVRKLTGRIWAQSEGRPSM